ncbi:MAG: hypothetical protein ABIQ30_01160 [Devosia sp.]
MDLMALTTQLLAMRMGATQQSAQIAIMKKSQDMEKSVLQLLAPPAPPGQGLVVDKSA